MLALSPIISKYFAVNTTEYHKHIIAEYGFTLSFFLLLVSTPYLLLIILNYLYWRPGSDGIIYHNSGATLFDENWLGYIAREICHSSEIMEVLFYSSPTPNFFNFFCMDNLYCFAVAMAFVFGVVLYWITKSINLSIKQALNKAISADEKSGAAE